jgi:hypothetical protein
MNAIRVNRYYDWKNMVNPNNEIFGYINNREKFNKFATMLRYFYFPGKDSVDKADVIRRELGLPSFEYMIQNDMMPVCRK